MTKQELYDHTYLMMNKCFLEAKAFNRNSSYKKLKAYCRDNSAKHKAYRLNNDDWIHSEFIAEHPSYADQDRSTNIALARTVIYQNFRQEYLRHVSNMGCDFTVFNSLFEPHRKHWDDTYGRDFKGVTTKKSFFVPLGE